MTVVVDANALLSMLGRDHPSGAILDAFLAGRFAWAVSNEIMLEYEEVAMERIELSRYERFTWLPQASGKIHRSLLRVPPSFRFHVITAEADYMLTADHHFDALTGSSYKPQPIAPGEFIPRHLGAA